MPPISKAKSAGPPKTALEALEHARKWTPKLVDAAFAEHGAATVERLAELVGKRDLSEKGAADDTLDYLLIHLLDTGLAAGPLLPWLEPLVAFPAPKPFRKGRRMVDGHAMRLFARAKHPLLRPRLVHNVENLAGRLDGPAAPFDLVGLIDIASDLGDETLAPLLEPLLEGLPPVRAEVSALLVGARQRLAALAAGEPTPAVIAAYQTEAAPTPAPGFAAFPPYAVRDEQDATEVATLTEEGRLTGEVGEIFAVLRAELYLEPLLVADREGVEQAVAALRDVFGAHLGYSVNSKRGSRVVRHQPKHWEDLTDWVAFLTPESAAKAEPLLMMLAKNHAFGPLTVDVSFKGRSEGVDAPGYPSPWTVSLYAEARYPEPPLEQAMVPVLLSFSVPVTFPLARFQNLVARVTSSLRVRWGTAGFGYARWEYFGRRSCEAHALQHLGFDRGDHEGQMARLQERLRSVNWLVLLGPVFWTQLPRAHQEALAAEFTVESAGKCLLVQASPAPEAGEGKAPAKYIRMDELLRPVRQTEVVEAWPNQHAGLAAWLRRFESAAT